MQYSWSVNYYDSDGDLVEKCILVHVEENTILKFPDIEHLENFAKTILHSIPEIKESSS